LGQKVHPVGMRLGINRTWKSKWFAKKDYAGLLREDLTIRKYVETKLSRAGISDVVIERKADKVVVNVRTARPGIVIGRKGIEVEKLNKELEHLTSKEIRINILEVKRVELDAQLVAEHIARQLEQRMGYRRAMRKAIESAMRMGAQGIRIKCSGRLGGSEMSRIAEQHEGRVPLHTLRADIDFARSTARTTHGTVGVKVWIFKGEKLGRQDEQEDERSGRDDRGSGRGRGDRGGRRADRRDRGGPRDDRGGRDRGGRKPGSGGRSRGAGAGKTTGARKPTGARKSTGARKPRGDAGASRAGRSGAKKPPARKPGGAKKTEGDK